MSKTAIEWTDETWNPITGCVPVSEGCDNCYARRMAKRLKAMGQEKYQNGPDGFRPTLHLGPMDDPLSWRKPRRVFVCSMSDVRWAPFHYLAAMYGRMAVSPHITYQILTKDPKVLREHLMHPEFEECVRAEAHGLELDGDLRSWHTTDFSWPLENVWVGVTAENQKTANERIPQLLETPAVVRFVSCEPLLSGVELWRSYPEEYTYCFNCGWHGSYYEYRCVTCGGEAQMESGNCLVCETGTMSRACPECHCTGEVDHPEYFCEGERPLPGIDWIISGGESGPGARPTNPEWVRSLRDQCQAADVPFMFKQWGAWAPCSQVVTDGPTHAMCDEHHHFVEFTREAMEEACHCTRWEGCRRVGKKAAGRELDGEVWDQYPDSRSK